jgi:hypothetical protein
VYQLQQLHRELDVSQAALTELELAALIPRGNVRHNTLAHRLGVGNEVLSLCSAPHHW